MSVAVVPKFYVNFLGSMREIDPIDGTFDGCNIPDIADVFMVIPDSILPNFFGKIQLIREGEFNRRDSDASCPDILVAGSEQESKDLLDGKEEATKAGAEKGEITPSLFD